MTASLYQSGSEVFGTAVIELLIRGSAASLPCSSARGRRAHVVLASVMMFHAKDVAWLATEGDRKHEQVKFTESRYTIRPSAPLPHPSPSSGRASAYVVSSCKWCAPASVSYTHLRAHETPEH